MGFGGNEKLPPRRISTVGIVRESRLTYDPNPLKHHQHYHGVPFDPPTTA